MIMPFSLGLCAYCGKSLPAERNQRQRFCRLVCKSRFHRGTEPKDEIPEYIPGTDIVNALPWADYWQRQRPSYAGWMS